MSTGEGLQLIIEELGLLELLCQTRLRRIEETERERDMFMEGERRVEELNERIDAKVSDACRALALGVHGPTLELVDRIVDCARKKDALVDQLEPTCNRLAAFVAEDLGQTPEDFEQALDLLIARVPRVRPKEAP